MRRNFSLSILLLSLALAHACGDDEAKPSPATTDADRDGISDADEGIETAVDTDGDGVPDYLDPDSDNDGILDSSEAGDRDLATPPRDADSDTVADFRDTDSDGNGLVDAAEFKGDTDEDGIPDYADGDDDFDTVEDTVELDGFLDPPLDSDADGIPNFKDPDSDNDSINDGHERGFDSDADGLQDWEDTDSDGDGFLDAEEAGDADLWTAPVDTDNDGLQDFRDPDSDNDGVPDTLEKTLGTSPVLVDSDGDEVTDLIEIGAETDPTDPAENPRERGDFVFVVPHMEPPAPERDTLVFRTNIQFADVYFVFDTTGSMITEIDTMRTAVEDILANTTCMDFGVACARDFECAAGQVCGPTGSCIEDPRSSSCVASLWTGVGRYDGDPQSYRNLSSIQGDAAMTRAQIPPEADGGGADEALFETTSCVANPMLCSAAMCATTGIGCPGFREDAVRIVVMITDENDQCTSCVSDEPELAGMELSSRRITFVGVNADTPSSRTACSSDTDCDFNETCVERQCRNDAEYDLERIALESGSVNGFGQPLVYGGDGAMVSVAVTEAINEIVEGLPLGVTIEATDEPEDAGDALQFIERLEVNVSGVDGCTRLRALRDTNGDSFNDAFDRVLPGTSVCWDVVVRPNTTVEAIPEPQVFRARLTVRGEGSVLDSRVVYFLIPPKIEDVPLG